MSAPHEHYSITITGVELLLLILIFVLMRMTYHVGVIAESYNPAVYSEGETQ